MSEESPSLPSVTKSHRSFKTARNLLALMLREMATTYGRNPGGYLWAFLEPIGAVALLSLVFSLALRAPPLGTDFAMFYASGYLPFMLYTQVTQKLATAIRFSRPLLAYPAVRYIDAVLARFVLNVLTHIIVASIIIWGIVQIRDLTIIYDFRALFTGFAMAAALALGIGLLNCFLFSVFRVWENIWAILNRPMFIISCILFTFESIPGQYRDYLWYNPLVHVVGMVRAGLFATYDATYVSMSYVFGVSAICCIFGLIFLNRYHRDILNDA